MVKEVTVVCYSNHRTFILLQVLFQPVDTFCIQVVGRLVQQQDVRFLQQQTTESYTTAFTSRQIFHRLVFGRTTQCVHRAFQLAVQIPCICSIDYILQLSLTGKQGIHFFGILVILRQTELIVYFFVFGKRIDYILYALHYYFFYSLGIVKVRLLSQITDWISRREHNFSLIVFLQTGNNFHQGRLTRTIQTDDTDLRSVEKR